MRVLILTRFYLNGQSTHVFSLCKELIHQGHSPFLVISNLSQQYLHWLQRNRIPYSSKMDLKFLKKLIHKEKIELIHTHSVHTLPLALELRDSLNIPVVATCHYLDFQPISELIKANRIIAISDEMKRQLKLPHQKTVVIENGVDTSIFRPLPKKSSTRNAIILTRMTPDRETAFAKVAQIMLNYDWKIISIGNWRPKDLKLTSLGWQIDVAPYLRQADLVIGTGRAIREGMAAGCVGCVLGDYFDGLVTPTTVEPLRKTNFSGRTFKHDLSSSLLEKTLNTLSSLTELRNLQQFSYRYGKNNFSLHTMVEKTITVYQSCF